MTTLLPLPDMRDVNSVAVNLTFDTFSAHISRDNILLRLEIVFVQQLRHISCLRFMSPCDLDLCPA